MRSNTGLSGAKERAHGHMRNQFFVAYRYFTFAGYFYGKGTGGFRGKS